MTKSASTGKKLLFLNPPAADVLIRDYYCSKSSRSNYLFPPIDFVMQSGILADEYQLEFIDAIRDCLSESDTAHRIESLNPAVIVFLAGAVNHPADLRFISTLAKSDRRLIGSGDIFLAQPLSWLQKFPFLDAVSLDFTNEDVKNYLHGEYRQIKRMAYRTSEGEVVEAITERSAINFSVGLPRHEIFISRRYNFPFAKKASFSVLLSDFGCPFHCRFCVMPSLPYGWRSNSEVVAELVHLRSLGITELFWMNQTFGVRKDETLELLREMESFSPLFSWTAFCRPDLLDGKLLEAMVKGGCHTIILGVENGSEEILRQYRKEYALDQVRRAFVLCREHGVRTVGTFILGLPGENLESIMATSQLAKEVGCDFASFHVAVPRAATRMREDAVLNGLIDREDFTMDQAGNYIAVSPDGIDRQTLQKMKKKAVLGFYLRPTFLLRQLFRKHTWYELCNMIKQGGYLISRELINGRDRHRDRRGW